MNFFGVISFETIIPKGLFSRVKKFLIHPYCQFCKKHYFTELYSSEIMVFELIKLVNMDQQN